MNAVTEKIMSLSREQLAALVLAKLGWDRVEHTSTKALRVHVLAAYKLGKLTEADIDAAFSPTGTP
jgi:hypothetical protein